MELEYVETITGNWHLPKNTPNCTVCNEIKAGRIYDKGIFDRVCANINPDMNVIDVGACFGQMSVLFAKRCKELGDGRVFSFECNVDLTAIVVKNATSNDSGNIDLFNYAAWNVNDHWLSFLTPSKIDCYGILGISPEHETSCKVLSRTIDSFDFENVGAVKIDAQGADLRVLYGMRDTIKRCKPFIAFEVETQGVPNFGYDLGAYMTFVKEIGYVIVDDIGLGNYTIKPRG